MTASDTMGRAAADKFPLPVRRAFAPNCTSSGSVQRRFLPVLFWCRGAVY